MKRLFLLLFSGVNIFCFTACKKDRTCSCTNTTTTTTTKYSTAYKSNYGYWIQDPNIPVTTDTETSTEDLTLGKVDKKTANKNCPKSYTSVSDVDNTVTYDTNNNLADNGSLKKGNTIHEEINKTCIIK